MEPELQKPSRSPRRSRLATPITSVPEVKSALIEIWSRPPERAPRFVGCFPWTGAPTRWFFFHFLPSSIIFSPHFDIFSGKAA